MVTLRHQERKMGGKYLQPEVEEIINQLQLSNEKLHEISDSILKEIKKGLAKDNGPGHIAMLPSFIPALPDGSEVGKYVAIDLSGKNLRIMLLTLRGKDQTQSVNNNYIISNHLMKGTGEQLFNFIVNCLQKFLKEFGLEEANLPIGFVFSYPCELLSIRSARLLWWTKGFDIEDCLQQDVVQLLEEALEMNMSTRAKIKAVMNDTVGQLAAASYKYGPECSVGVVIGYGCNSSYLEETSRITKFNAEARGYKHKKMVVVTEWEEYGSNGELDDILTQFDRENDEASVHKGKQIIDKLTGALYLGELVRRILSQLVLDRIMFDGQPCEKLEDAESFPTKYISEILEEEEGSFRTCRRICDELDVPFHGSSDYVIIREVCEAVSQRSASIVAAAISALLSHLQLENVKIGVGGALIQFHPTYHKMLENKLAQLVPLTVNWQLVPADEGSARGAALIAAVAEKLAL